MGAAYRRYDGGGRSLLAHLHPLSRWYGVSNWRWAYFCGQHRQFCLHTTSMGLFLFCSLQKSLFTTLSGPVISYRSHNPNTLFPTGVFYYVVLNPGRSGVIHPPSPRVESGRIKNFRIKDYSLFVIYEDWPKPRKISIRVTKSNP